MNTSFDTKLKKDSSIPESGRTYPKLNAVKAGLIYYTLKKPELTYSLFNLDEKLRSVYFMVREISYFNSDYL